jgi:hypothetical protein
LPTFSIASAIISPTSVVAVGRDGADLGDLRSTLTFFERFLRSATTFVDGLVDAALQVHRVHAGGNRLHAFADDGLGQNGGGGGAVTGGVVGLRGDFAHHLGAHVLELVFSSISLATVTPSLVMRGAPKTCR